MAQRHMTMTERGIADAVFQGTVPYNMVRITDLIGLENRPYTMVYMGMEKGNLWHVNVGQRAFHSLGTNLASQSLLIHELTHVWQSAHSGWAPAYIFNSVWHQLIDGKKAAYGYVSGLSWNSYSVEQQARIVEDWFASGKSESDPNYRYIRDNIRKAKKFT